MTAIIEQIKHDLKQAMLAKDKKQVNALRLITAAIKQVEVDERIEIDETRMLDILNKLAKQRRESIRQYEQAQRIDLVEQEQYELDIISRYLPKPLNDNEIQSLIRHAIKETHASTINDMGKVVSYLRPQIKGRADMAQVSSLIKAHLS